MTRAQILKAALHLPEEERELLVAELAATLPESSSRAVERAWVDEIERRIVEADAGAIDSTPWSSARSR